VIPLAQITIVTVEEQRDAETVLAPSSTHHGHVATAFAWS